MRQRLSFIPIGIMIALAPMATVALATSGGRSASACPNERVVVGGKSNSLRFVLRGVSCSKAHTVIRAYFQAIAAQSCRNRGTACIFIFPGGWACSFRIPALNVRAIAECSTDHAPFYTITVYDANHPDSTGRRNSVLVA